MHFVQKILFGVWFTAICAASQRRIYPRATFQQRMPVDAVVDVQGKLSTAKRPFALQIRDTSSKVGSIYLRGRRKMVFTNINRRKWSHYDHTNVGPGKVFRMLIRQRSNSFTFYLLNPKHEIVLEKSFPIVIRSIVMQGAFFRGSLVKSKWNKYIGIPTECGKQIEVSDPPTRFCQTGSTTRSNRVRIIGGSPTRAGEYPWQVSIWESRPTTSGKTWNHICGGTLIAGCWVVSAAHCFPQAWDTKSLRVRVGDYYNRDDHVKDFSIYENSQDLNVKKIYIHGQYYSGEYTANDVALLLLQPDSDGNCTQYGRFVQPACLPSSADEFTEGTPCIITGWGASQHGQTRIEYPACLQKAQVNLISNQQCKEDYPDIRPQNPYDPMIEVVKDAVQCTRSSSERRTDSCQGDSGGPLICVSEDRRSVLWGITSWGKRCGEYYGVYTRVHSILGFLDKHLLQVTKFNP